METTRGQDMEDESKVSVYKKITTECLNIADDMVQVSKPILIVTCTWLLYIVTYPIHKQNLNQSWTQVKSTDIALWK